MKMQGNFQKKQQWGKVEIFALTFSAVMTVVLFVGIISLMQPTVSQPHQFQQPINGYKK